MQSLAPNSTETIHISKEQVGKRLDKLLAEHFPSYSRTYFQFLIENGCVLLNGERIKKREKPKIDDEIEICFLITPELSLEPENIPLNILYEDEHLIAINKPPGMVVHPAPGHPSGTFVNALLFHCHNLKTFSDNLRPGIVHRLDKDTSGILLAAKTLEAHQRLVSLFCNRQIQKYYLALALGNPGDGLIDAPIARHPVKRKEMSIDIEKGKPSITQCRHIAKIGEYSLLELKLITGRTHQIRIHLKHKGTPILGDPVYGSSSANQKHRIERQMLHASYIQFIHPFSNICIELRAPIPDDMSSLIPSFLLAEFKP
jgi:23S rRNA pseudouridine1911/1915/1917 synthase